MEKYYRSEEKLHINCEKPRAYFVPFGTAAGSERRRDISPFFRSLNGKWDFAYIENTDAFLPADDSCPRAEYTGEIRVPSNWQLYPELCGDTPQYINQDYPFPVDPPHLPDVIPSGFYHRNFTCEKKNKRYFLDFEGVSSCFYVWLNGTFVGFGSVSHCTNEFEITSCIADGENDICVLVVKYCVGSYCEDQDFFRLSGIFRDVYILERETNAVRDIYVRREVSEDLSKAVVSVDIESDGDVAINWLLSDNRFSRITTGLASGSFSFEIENPVLWNPEEPYVYNLCVRSGNEYIDIPLAVRRFEIKDSVVLLNNVPVKARGVNRHDSHPEKGYACDYEHFRRDLLILKSANVNTIRTSHYPNDPRFLELCDRMGFMVIDEADLETHGMGYNFGDWYWDYWAHICDDSRYRELCLDRAVRLFERDKNSGCVIMWSLGNESGCGENHRAMAEYIRSRNPDNLIHYENAHLEYSARVGKDFSDISDVESRMYAPTEYLRGYLDNSPAKPFFYCEYVCSMSTGDVYKHWDGFEDDPAYFGGCIWEYCDHAVNVGTPESPKYRYGGDWGEYPNDTYSCVDGLVYPDRKARPGFFDMKKVYEPYSVQYEKGIIAVKNRKFFTGSRDIYIEWTVETDGKINRRGAIDSPDIPAGAVRRYGLFENCVFGGNTVLNVSFRERSPRPWADKGTEIAFSQFVLSEETIDLSEKSSVSPVVRENASELAVIRGDVVYTFDKIRGVLKSVVKNNNEILDRPCAFSIMRATTYNTRGRMDEWKRARYDRAVQKTYSFDVTENGDGIDVTVGFALASPAMPPAVRGKAVYSVGSDGVISVSVTADVTENAPPLPEFAFMLYLSPDFENVRYYGYGPQEAYSERHRAARLGYFKTTVTDNLETYIKPQESSAHFGTKLAVVGSMYSNLAIAAVKPSAFSFNAMHATWDMLENTAHFDELRPLKTSVIKLAYDLDNHVKRFDEKHIEFAFALKF